TKIWSSVLSQLHDSGVLGRTTEVGANFLFPMVRVATNLPGEVLAKSPIGFAAQGIQLLRLLADKDKMGKSGLDLLTMHDFDNVMRGLKRGSLGLALAAIGYAYRNNITGYYLTEA